MLHNAQAAVIETAAFCLCLSKEEICIISVLHVEWQVEHASRDFKWRDEAGDGLSMSRAFL